MVEKVVTQGKSVAVSIKGLEGSRSTLLDSGSSRRAGEGKGRRRMFSVVVFVFWEVIPHRVKILSYRYFVISMVAYNFGQLFVLFFFVVI